MTQSNPRRTPWRHLHLPTDSPDVEWSSGVQARIAMGASVMIADVRMAAGATQPDRRHSGETIITVLAGAASIRQGELRTDLVEGDVVVVPGDVTYSVVAGPAGCARWDVYSPPDVALAEEAFHQEHATHGFE